MNADLVAMLSQYATYKTRWQLAAIYPCIYHPLIANRVLVTGYNNRPEYDVDEDDITDISIFTGSDIYIERYGGFMTYRKRESYIRYGQKSYDYKNSCGFINYSYEKIFAGLKLSANYIMYIIIEFVKGECGNEWQIARNRDKIFHHNHIYYHTYTFYDMPVPDNISVYSWMEPDAIDIRDKRYSLAAAKDWLDLLSLMKKMI